VRPRNVTATDAEREAILALATPHMRLFILLCSDLAIRAGTAGILAPQHYDAPRGTLRFTTKKAEKVTLPVTAEVRELLASCSLDSNVPFVRQLWRIEQTHGKRPYPRANARSSTLSAKFRRLKDEAGIERKLTPHDLRRTTAVAMLQHSGDVRDVQALLGHRSLQSTIWYLDHDLRPVSLDALETIKRPFLVRKEHTA
jgi:integrase